MLKKQSEKCYLIFEPHRGKLLKRLLHPRYGHVSALVEFGNMAGWMVHADVRLSSVGLYLVHESELDTSSLCAGKVVSTIIKVKRNETAKGFDFPVLTCVGMIKRLLGIKAWYVFTPYQLLRYIENNPEVHYA